MSDIVFNKNEKVWYTKIKKFMKLNKSYSL